MPPRDHFRPLLDERRSWEELHGGWPMMLVAALSRRGTSPARASPSGRTSRSM